MVSQRHGHFEKRMYGYSNIYLKKFWSLPQIYNDHGYTITDFARQFLITFMHCMQIELIFLWICPQGWKTMKKMKGIKLASTDSSYTGNSWTLQLKNYG